MHKNKITVVVVLLVLVGLFSWYEIRPSYIRNKCLTDARENAVLDTNQPQYYKNDLIERTKLQDQLIEKSYLNCVREYGLSQ
jgi:hypothetical protein